MLLQLYFLRQRRQKSKSSLTLSPLIRYNTESVASILEHFRCPPPVIPRRDPTPRRSTYEEDGQVDCRRSLYLIYCIFYYQ